MQSRGLRKITLVQNKKDEKKKNCIRIEMHKKTNRAKLNKVEGLMICTYYFNFFLLMSLVCLIKQSSFKT